MSGHSSECGKRLNRRTLMTGLGLSAASGLVSGPWTSPAAAQNFDASVAGKTIKIGMSAGITGPIAFASQQFVGYMQRYFEKLNASGINGRKIELITLDDGGKGDVALQNAQRLLQQERVLAMTAVGTATTAAILDYLTRMNVPFLFPGSYNTELIAPVRANTFSLYQPYEGQVGAITKWGFKTKGAGSAVIIRANLPSLDLSAKSAAQAVEASGGRVEATLNTSFNQPEWASIVIRIKSIRPDYLILITSGPDMGRFWKEVMQQNAMPAKATLGASPLADQAFLDAAGEVPDNVTFAAVPATTVPSTAEAKEVRDLWPDQRLGIFGLQGATSAVVTAEALKRAGADLSRKSLVDALNSFAPFKPAFADTAKAAADHLLIPSVGVATTRKGEFVLAMNEFIL